MENDQWFKVIEINSRNTCTIHIKDNLKLKITLSKIKNIINDMSYLYCYCASCLNAYKGDLESCPYCNSKVMITMGKKKGVNDIVNESISNLYYV